MATDHDTMHGRSNEPTIPITLADRIRGCLIGGAVGDALGAPVEFMSLSEITDIVGRRGVRDYLPVAFAGVQGRGLITDDTQMTLFTVEGLIRMLSRARDYGLGATCAVLHRAYWRWLDTQDRTAVDPSVDDGWLRTQPWLYSRRAPGNTCLSALRANRAGDAVIFDNVTRNAIGEPASNASKGCGGVMRSAPFGFLPEQPAVIFAYACEAAAYTHGHPTGQHASGALALIIAALTGGAALPGAVASTIAFLHAEPGTDETLAALQLAVTLAEGDTPPSPDVLAHLGQGWIAEEALAIAVYAALAYPKAAQVRDALALAVTHSGDADSTGAICGNILGTAHGLAAIPPDLAFQVEGRGTMLELADDLWYEITAGFTSSGSLPTVVGHAGGAADPGLHDQEAWSRRYPPA